MITKWAYLIMSTLAPESRGKTRAKKAHWSLLWKENSGHWLIILGKKQLPQKPITTTFVLGEIKKGFSYGSFERLKGAMGVSSKDLESFIGIPSTTLTNRRKKGQFSPQESDRIARIAKIFKQAVDLFEGDSKEAKAWLWDPNKALSGEAPIVHAETSIGAEQVSNLIGQIEHTIY